MKAVGKPPYPTEPVCPLCHQKWRCPPPHPAPHGPRDRSQGAPCPAASARAPVCAVLRAPRTCRVWVTGPQKAPKNSALERASDYLLLLLLHAPRHPLSEGRPRGISFAAFESRQNIQIFIQNKREKDISWLPNVAINRDYSLPREDRHIGCFIRFLKQ